MWKYEEVECPDCGGEGCKCQICGNSLVFPKNSLYTKCNKCGHDVDPLPCSMCNTDGTIKGDHIIITSPVVASCFIGLKVIVLDELNGKPFDKYQHILDLYNLSFLNYYWFKGFKVHKSEVCKAMENPLFKKILEHYLSGVEKFQFNSWLDNNL